MFAIIDCNNFYASCERLFRPDLANKPIIVLSNNDGCVIARSNEAKALQIKMGQPYFQIKKFCEQHHVQVFSSNYTLYGDLSARVMNIIRAHWQQVEVYSIDEAFLNLSDLPSAEQESFCQNLRQRILKEVGIPTSIGIGQTKTLAKAANFLAKKSFKRSVLKIEPTALYLRSVPIEDVWGIGYQWSKKLNIMNIHTAEDLRQQSAHLIRTRFSLPLMQTTLELQGEPCHELQNSTPKKSITASRSFGACQTDIDILAQALSAHCARATEKLNQQNGMIEHLSVFIRTNPFQPKVPQYANRYQIQLPHMTNDLRIITHFAKLALEKIYKPNFKYHKIGVWFEHIHYTQQHSFLPKSGFKNTAPFMQVLEEIHQKYGKNALYLAAEGTQKPWQMKAEKRSPKYTTCWDELPLVHLT